MKAKSIFTAVLTAVLLAGSISVTAFAEETDEKYNSDLLGDGTSLSELVQNIETKTEYKEFVSAAADKIAEYIQNMPADSDIEQRILLLKEKWKSHVGDVSENPEKQSLKEIEDSIKNAISDIMEKTNEKTEESEDVVLYADQTEFTWDRGSDTGITIQTDSASKEFIVKKDGRLYSASSVSGNLMVDYGTVYLGNDFLQTLDDGENRLQLVMKEGSLDIVVHVTDNDTEIPVSDNEITAKETYFEWDKSELIGIAVNTDSKSRNVVISKDGEQIASDDDRGVYVILGRVGITAKILKKLDIGENRLTLAFDDGTAEITVNVTDKKHTSKEEITADKTEFTWNRNSSESIVIKTNSKSENISVRQSGKIFSTSDKANISVNDGTVTLKPEFLNKLNDGENELKLTFDDGNITVRINVTGSAESSKNSSVSSKNSDSSSGIGVLPSTGSESLTFGAVIALLSAGLSGILLSRKREK